MFTLYRLDRAGFWISCGSFDTKQQAQKMANKHLQYHTTKIVG